MNKKIVLTTLLILVLIGVLSLAFNIQTVRAAGTIYIKADGSIDPSNASITRNGDLYTLTSNITSGPNDGIVIERDNMTLDGAGYTIKGGWTGLKLNGRTNVTIRNIRLEDFYYGFQIGSCSNITICENYISGKDTFVGIYFLTSSNTKILGNTFTHYERGIDFYNSPNNSIHGNRFAANTYAGILMGGSSSNDVSENNMTNNRFAIQIGMSSTNNTVTRNLMTNNTSGGVLFTDSENNTIVENAITNNGIGILIDRSHRNNISRNEITDNNNGVDFDAYSEHNNIVENNIANNKKNGVTLYRSSYNNILCNNITANDDDGIHLDVSYSTPSTYNTIVGNNIISNWRGINLNSSSSYNTISQNIITNNAYGIWFNGSSSYNTVCENTVAGNVFGVWLNWSSGNSFYHNNFMNNSSPAYTTNSANAWNNSFSEGNYWSNYHGADANRDGIGDTPHTIYIYTSERDYYPLMNSYIPGDISHDGVVNIKDAARIGVAWNTTRGTLGYNPHADLNMDEIINMADADIIRRNWQKHL